MRPAFSRDDIGHGNGKDSVPSRDHKIGLSACSRRPNLTYLFCIQLCAVFAFTAPEFNFQRGKVEVLPGLSVNRITECDVGASIFVRDSVDRLALLYTSMGFNDFLISQFRYTRSGAETFTHTDSPRKMSPCLSDECVEHDALCDPGFVRQDEGRFSRGVPLSVSDNLFINHLCFRGTDSFGAAHAYRSGKMSPSTTSNCCPDTAIRNSELSRKADRVFSVGVASSKFKNILVR